MSTVQSYDECCAKFSVHVRTWLLHLTRFSSLTSCPISFGGIYEDGSRETCLADFWSLNLDKLDQWNCILSDDVNAVTWLGEESDEDDDDDEEEEDDEDEEDEADDNGEENDDGEDGVEDDSTSHEGRQQEEEKLKKSKKESKPELERKVGEGAPLEAGIAQTPKQEEAPSPPTISAEGDPMPKGMRLNDGDQHSQAKS